jgi:DNA polymerase-1
MPKSSKKGEKKKRLVLLDAHAIIHRAYHALPDFSGPDGQPTGALYGLSSMLLRIIDDLAPDYIAACYDLPKPTMRHEAYAGYKATRATSDDALVAQLSTSRDVFQAFCIPIYEKEGFEADDILGTIVTMLKADQDTDIIIASGDMDTMQLVDGKRVQVYTLKKGLNDTILYDEKAVEARYGFAPEYVADYKGLRGDPSDNIIGVPGIGEKTGTELIQKFGTIEEIYKKLKKSEQPFLDAGVKPRIVALLKEHEEDAVFSKMLATIRTDAPIAFKLEDARAHPEDRLSAVLALFDKLGFRSMRGRARAVLGGEGSEEDVAAEALAMEAEEAAAAQDVDSERFKEAQVMLWLLASDFTNPELDDILAYSKEKTFDAAYAALEQKLRATGRLADVYDRIEKPLIAVIDGMEKCGVLIDKSALEKLKDAYRAELNAIEERVHKAAGAPFNISSPKQLGDVLFDTLGLKAKGQKKTAGGQRSTRESELEKIKDLHPIVADILEYRELQKLLTAYLESIPAMLDEHGRLHAKFLQTGTTTGRMASADPNLQNIPIRTERGRAIRHAFVAPEGFTLLALDYSQIELRLAAILSGDEKLIDIFKNGRDVHREVAALVFGVAPEAVDYEMRRRAKVINFGILYGMGTTALRAQLGTSASEAQKFYDDYFNTFTRLAQYLEETRGYARKHGFTETFYGRRREFPGMKSPLPYVRAQAERMAINAPIQGTEADIVKLAMVQVDELLAAEGLKDDAHLILQVHDELVYEARTDKLPALTEKIRRAMEDAFPKGDAKGVPILVEAKAGKDWGSMQPL